MTIQLKPLVDTGANGWLFIDTLLGYNLAQRLGVNLERLPRSIPVKGYDGQPGNPASHVLRMHLLVDDRKLYNIFSTIPPGHGDDNLAGGMAILDISLDARNIVS